MHQFLNQHGQLKLIALVALLSAAAFFLYPKYEYKQLKKKFRATVDISETLFRQAQNFYMRESRWPTAMSDLPLPDGAKRNGDWEISSDLYTCELAYGRGDKKLNELVCAPKGKYERVLMYQIFLSERPQHRRLCKAKQNAKKLTKLCERQGGKFVYTVSGKPPLSAYAVVR